MPEMSGVELARAVTDMKPSLPVVLLSGYVERCTPDQLAASGIREVIAKPATLADLARVLHAMLRSADVPR